MRKSTNSRRLGGRAKFMVDFGPLLVFFIAYFFGGKIALAFGGAIEEGGELFLAVGFFMPTYAIAFAYSVIRERRIAPMLLVSGVAIGVLGSLTLILHDKTFFYMKPTIVYIMFALTLAAGLATGRNFLRTLFDGAVHLPDAAWRILTRRYVIFFTVLALANEIAWRWLTRECDLSAASACAGEGRWVNLKIWGFTGINIIFAIVQAPFLVKHAETKEATDGQSPSTGLE